MVEPIELLGQFNTPQSLEAQCLAPMHHPGAHTPDPKPHPLPYSPTNNQLPYQSNTLFIYNALNQEICQEVKDLLAQAKQCSDRAKCFSGQKKRQIYQQKALALSQAIELFPQGFRVISLEPTAGMIGLLPPTGRRMHCFLQDMTVPAKQLLASQVLKSFTM